MLIAPATWNEAANRLQLSGFVLDLNRGELLTPHDERAGLRKQALDVLLVLGARAGQVASKEELMSRVWPDVVVGEGSLVQAIGGHSCSAVQWHLDTTSSAEVAGRFQ